ncbi:MAG: hypothetical protein WCH99_21965, partial [Verrucomicrobiota bacterium]
MTTLPKINRGSWIALWAQDRRRRRVRAAQAPLLPAPVLRPAYPDLLQWDWDCPNPYQWNVYVSLDGGVTFFMPEGYWVSGEGREFAPDGGSELYFIFGVDADGRVITQHSNPVCPDDASPPPPPPAQDFTGYNYYSPDYTTIDDGSTVVGAGGNAGNGTYTFSGGSAWNENGDWLFPSNDNDGNPVWQICLQDFTDMYWSDSWNPIDPSGTYNFRNNNGPTISIEAFSATYHSVVSEDRLSWTDNSGGTVIYYVTGPSGEIFRGSGSFCTTTAASDGHYALFAVTDSGDVLIG